ncbi:bifunctional phosphoribosyl-AMP cyclohydrolase/phosphoribosyl-ATP diphosphatase HisIE [Tepidanaerobacter syntrophicus]|uniref:Histidine biosynthesis bifunctional protein HisIE n=1 Tax=Tepidanaerobacter syntrophicus TaxID=224999 RepID=A0A0U9HCN6_9FIRM|nr:bifunctional phosphoribosyl-AMP cyclohydrolase/phosphoribosyl-ATP diphosphatase HisIE [Tepidanaerobacter syntrophicus]GAQ24494.1 phosphoribosyl-ATP pyrophosphohydrolase [Tepidanaerobacter syntrophicus]GLI18208.1 histidine biosynthesis bifunctional protein HisIE [Tepidanaerobacter syntrophicus]
MIDIKYGENGLVPAIVQDYKTKEVLMLAYMNEESLMKTLETGTAWFYSRKRKSLWQKGETSGNFLYVKSIFYDCDEDALLLKVDAAGPACHTGNVSCFYRSLKDAKEAEETEEENSSGTLEFLDELAEIIDSRFSEKPEASYVAKLYKGGRERILKKVGEEAAEVIIASMSQKKDDIVYESADLIFHLLVALRYDGISLEEIADELEKRHKQRS